MKTKLNFLWSIQSTLITLSGLLVATGGQSQTALSPDEARHYASLTRHDPRGLNNLPLAIKADLHNAFGIYEGDYGGLFIPDADFTAQSLSQVQTEPKPVGELWLRNLAPMKNGWAASERDLFVVDVQASSERLMVPCCPLAVRRNQSGALELLLYGKSPEPLLTLPMGRIDRAGAQPVMMRAERQPDSGLVTIELFGKYQGQFRVAELMIW